MSEIERPEFIDDRRVVPGSIADYVQHLESRIDELESQLEAEKKARIKAQDEIDSGSWCSCGFGPSPTALRRVYDSPTKPHNRLPKRAWKHHKAGGTAEVIDITGQKFGHLTAVEFLGIDKRSMWRCACSCGKETVVSLSALRSGNTKSCGHLKAEKAAQVGKVFNKTHGRTATAEYNSWRSMKSRCLNKNNPSYERYKHLSICEEWLDSFESFYKDMGKRPKGKTIGRIDNNEGYYPWNCRWETPKQQANNRRSSRKITAFGETMTMAQWSDRLEIKIETLFKRLKTMNPEKAFIKGDMRKK